MVLTNPVVHPKVGQSVCKCGVPSTDAPGCQVQSRHSSQDTDVAHCDQWGLARGEDMGLGVQMQLVGPARGETIAPGQALDTSACVDQDVRGPAKHLVEDERANGDNGGVGSVVIGHLLKKARLGFPALDFGTAWWHKHGVLFHVVVVSVVTCVGKFPAEEGYEQNAVEEPAGDSINGEIVGERIMAAVVSKDPKSREETSLDETVQNPEWDPDR